MELPQSNTLIPVYSYTRTELLSLRTKTSLLSLSTVDRLKDLNIGYHLPRRHRSSRGVKRKKKKFPSFIVASFNAQSVKGNDMACKRSIEHLLLQTHLNQTTIALNPTSIFQSLSLLPYTGLLGTLLTLTAHHLLLNFPVFQSFHLLKMQTSSVTFCALY